MKFLKTFENYDPEQETKNIEQDSPMLKGKEKITEFDLSEDEMPEDDILQGEDVMPEGIAPLGESRSERSTMLRRGARKSREEIMKMIRQKARAARRRQLLVSKPQD